LHGTLCSYERKTLENKEKENSFTSRINVPTVVVVVVVLVVVVVVVVVGVVVIVVVVVVMVKLF
jgi:hypothetical protein